MSGGTIKKTIAAVMAAVALFTMTGCGINGEKKSEEAGNTKEMVFEGVDFPIEGYQGDIDRVCVKNGRIYFNTCEWIQENASVNRLYSCKSDGSDITEIPLPFIGEKEWVCSIAIGNDGTIAFLLNAYDEKADKNTYVLVKVDEQGNELLKTDITKVLNMTQDDSVGKVLMDDKGRFIITMRRRACILDENGKSTGEVKSEYNLEGAAITRDGEVVCASNVLLGESRYARVQVLDVENRSWGDTIKLDSHYFPGSDSVMDGMEYDFYYKDNSGIYGYDIEGKKSDVIMDYLASNVTSENSWDIVPIGKDKLLGTASDENGTKFIFYGKVAPDDIREKKTIIYGGVSISEDVRKAAVEFNKSSKEYQIEFKDYADEEDPETKMNLDIVSGNIPDIIELNYIPVDQYMAKGMFEDLTPYYEKDSELSTDDILDSVLEAMKADGKIYYVTSGFLINTIVARTADVGDGTGWTFDELKELLEKKGDDVKIFRSDNKADMLYSLLGYGLSDFINWQTGECSFDSEDFKDILEICNSRGLNEEKQYNEDEPSVITLMQEGKILFIETNVFPEEGQVCAKIYDEGVTWIGYPNKEKEGSYFWFENQIGISSKSEVKDGAWEFIRTFMTKEYQGMAWNRYADSCVPTRKDCFDLMMKRKTATEVYRDEFGQEVLPLDYYPGYSWSLNGIEVEIKPLSDEEADMYINLVNSTKKNGRCDEAMMKIVLEEAKVYFAGEKSLDETVNIIQNRIKTYVNEGR